MNIARETLRLYAITDEKCIGERDFFETVESALKGGVTILQLREKGIGRSELVKKAKELKKLCERYGVPLIVNDDYEAAIEAGADGVHVGLEDSPVEEIRRIAGEKFIIGATAKTVEQAKKAQAAGADYIGVGAVFPSPTKQNAVRITLNELKAITASVDIPAVAIGGITKENLAELKGCGAAGLALVSAVFGTEDIERECRELYKLIGTL